MMASLTQQPFDRVHSLLANKLSDLADYLRDDLVDTLKTLQPDCVSPPDHEALENARCLLVCLLVTPSSPNL